MAVGGLKDEELERALEHDRAVPADQRIGRPSASGVVAAIEDAVAHLDRGEVAAARALLENAVARIRSRGVWL